MPQGLILFLLFFLSIATFLHCFLEHLLGHGSPSSNLAIPATISISGVTGWALKNRLEETFLNKPLKPSCPPSSQENNPPPIFLDLHKTHNKVAKEGQTARPNSASRLDVSSPKVGEIIGKSGSRSRVQRLRIPSSAEAGRRAEMLKSLSEGTWPKKPGRKNGKN